MRWIFLLVFVVFIIQINAQIQLTQPVRFLALGDSYTIGQSVEVEDRWPVQLKDELLYRGIGFSKLKIIAQTGWRTDNLINTIETQNPDSSYNLVSLLIGVNNQYQGAEFEVYIAEFEQLLKKAIKLAGSIKESVFVLSIPDYGYTPFGSIYQNLITPEIDKYNQANKLITEKYGIAYINITPISRQGIEKPEYVAWDGLHPSREMYAEWVVLILESMGFGETTNDKSLKDKIPFKMSVHSNENRIIFHSSELINIRTTFQIINLSGSLVMSGTLLKNEIDVSGLDRGVYLVQVKIDKGNKFVKKVIIGE